VVAAVIAWVHLGERLTLMQMTGGFFVLCAVVVLQALKPKLTGEKPETAAC
jgi:drug/metabolite transporter (DMT)-like permease